MRAAIISLLIISSLYCISATSDPYNGAYWLRNTEVGLGNYEPGYFGMNVPGPYSWTPFSGNFGLYDIEGVINEGGNLVSGGGFYNYVVQVDDDDEGDDDQFPQTLEDPFQILYQVGQLNEYHGAARDFFPDGSGRTFIFKQDCYLTPFTQETLCENYFFTEDGLPFDQGKNFYVQLYRDYDVGFGNNDVIVTDIGTPQVKVFQIELSDDDDAGQGAGIIIDAATTVGCTYNGWSFGNCCEALKPNTFSFDGSALADGNVCSGYGGIYIRDRDIFHFPTANAYGCGDYSGDYLVGMQVTANPGASTLSFQSREAMIWGYKDTNTYSRSHGSIIFEDTFDFTDTLDVLESDIITEVEVSLLLQHTWISDLVIDVTSPSGTNVVLFNSDCGSSDHIFETFADGGGDICVDANPAAPLEPLSTFNGEDQQGTWTLHINDSVGGDSGEINDWFIRINGENYRGSIPGLPIDDSAPTVSSIDVTDNFIIVDTFVTFDMPHSFVGDLEVTLQSPTGTIINLLDNQCDSTVNIFETFADGGGDICVDANPAAPLEPLSTFAGENAFGTWELIITDNLEGDSGTLNYWQLDFHPNACGNGVREATEQCDTIDHGLETCQSIAGLPHGQLSCRHDCTFDVSHCSAETFIRTTPGKNVLVMDTSYLYDDDDTVDGIGSIVQAERANLFTYRNNGYNNDREFLENNLCGVDLLIANFQEVTEESVENVRNFVSLGGSVFITGNTYYADEDDYNGELFGISRYYNDYSWSGNETPHIVKNIASGMTTGLIDMRGRDSALGFGYSDDDISIEILAFGFGDSGISVVDLEDDYCNNYIAGNYCSVSAFQRIGDGYMYFNGASFSDSKQYSTQQFFSSNSFIRNTIYNARGIAPKPFQFDDRPITLGIDFRNFADYCEGASVSLYRDGVLINTFTNPNGIARYVDNLTGCFDYSLTYNAPGGSFFQQTQQLETFNFCGREVFEQQNFIKPNRNLSFLDCSNPDSRFERNLCDSVNNTA